jgi:4-amino-4-deoxy-L-arabinose transferase-like glycosyltransferase
VRTPLLLFGLAFVVRLALIGLYPDAAYPDSYYYVDVARSLSAGHGLTVPFVWIFAEVGNRIPDVPVLPIPSNAHWLPLASIIQAPFLMVLGPTGFASALPLAIISATAAPLTWLIARDAGSKPIVGTGAGVLAAIPAAGTVFMGQPENFALLLPLVAATLWLVARGLKGSAASFALAGLLAGLASLARNDGVLLFGAVGLIWVGDRVRWWVAERRAGAIVPASAHDPAPRRPIPLAAAVASVGLFLLVMGPWWLRQIAVFGSISPTSANGAALWIRDMSEWNSITAHPSLSSFLSQGVGPIVASRVGGLAAAVTNFAVVICSVVLLPLVVVGGWRRRRSIDFVPWFVYTAVVFAGATLLYPVHVPGGAFIHSAIGLAPYAYILALEGVLALVSAVARRRPSWREKTAGPVFVWATVAFTVATAIPFGAATMASWDAERQPRIALAAELDRLGVPATDRLLSIDAAGMTYWTGRPGVVTPDDPLDTIEAVARAYGTRWLVLERDSAAASLAPVLVGTMRPPWIGGTVFAVPSPDGGLPRLALYPVCTTTGDDRCDGAP